MKNILLGLMALTSTAFANDSTAVMGAGGLILVRADAVTMQSEDLYVSPSHVRVNYEFRNNDKDPRSYLVAFPMPIINPDTYLDSDISIPKQDQDNFLDFKLAVEGKPVQPQLEMRALSGGLDVTDELKALSIPLNPLASATRGFIAKIPRDKLAGLIKKGAVVTDESSAFPSWALKSTYYWYQDFPGNAVVHVAHTYAPAIGGAFYSATSDLEKRDQDTYCVDKSTRAAITTKLNAATQEAPYLSEKILQYILTTGANWSGTIENFRLVVDKEKPEAIVSFCLDGVTKISPTQFEVKQKDFNPERELDVLILSEMPKQ